MEQPTGRQTRLEGTVDGSRQLLDDVPMPAQIGRFGVRAVLGHGGMGVVYAARDADLDRDVAIKLLRARGEEGTPGRARLLREARSMARLSHPNVITIYEVGTHEDRIFLAMELVHGVDLRAWLRERPRTWRGVLERFVDAGKGLAAAHAAGIIHRDFKPDNVLVGDDGRVRVVDFGLARTRDDDSGDDLVGPGSSNDSNDSEPEEPAPPPERLTLTGMVMGTPAYMAPEQWRGGVVDQRTDLFAFCVALWEALFGQRPFGGKGSHAIATRVMSGEIRHPPEGRDVPPWLVRVLRRGLSVDPDQRYGSMDALLTVLTRLRSHRGAEEAAIQIGDDRSAAKLFAGRYELRDHEGASPRSIARDRITRRLVAIDRWRARGSGTDTEIERLRALAGLGHPNIASVLDHGFDDRVPYLVVDHSDDMLDVREWARDQPRAIRWAAIAQLLRALVDLHGRGLVHARLSPSTLAMVGGQLRIHALTPCLDDTIDGDDAYAAPEVLLGESRTAAADIYSVGVLALELSTGRQPHGASAPGELVDAALAGNQPRVGPELEGEIAAVVGRMLAIDPRARFPSADLALRAFVRATRSSLTIETVETRECTLRTARLAGRELELGVLVNAMRRSFDGQGELWLLGGESGIGKSRLLDELRAEAVARGALVIRGLARADAGRPYEIWREVLRTLALLGADDAAAAVLAPLVADIDQLRGQPHEIAAELDAKSAQQRLLRAVVDALRALTRPVVILLDDLQWAGSESIDLLQRVAQRLAGLPVSVIAGYRNDEARDLPGTIDNAKAIALGPLDASAIASLAGTMTGSDAAELQELLRRETEGNALLLVEVMRFLAEEAGDLRAVASMQLPASVAAGGVRRMMRRRLERVEPWARPLLELAAVFGRTLDPEVLALVEDGDEVTRMLAHCADVAILERDSGRWRFRHDKLREQLLAELDPDRRRELHRRIGDALTRRPGGEDSQVQALAHHFREAGELDREARYSGRAGEQALANGAYRDAARLLSRALELREHDHAERAQRMRWQRKLGEAHYVLGDLSRAIASLEQTLAEGGWALPRTRIGLLVLLVRLVFVQVVLLAWPGRLVARDPGRREQLREAAEAAGRIANLSTYSGDLPRIFSCSLLSANLGERAGRPSAYSLAVMGYSASYLGMPRIADRYFARASAAAIEQDDPIALVEATQMECVYRLGTGEFARCRQLMDDCYAAAERADYQLGLALTEGFVGQCEYLLGNFEQMLAHYTRARELLTLRSPEHEHSFLCGEALALCMLGRFVEARALLDDGATRIAAVYPLGEAFVRAIGAQIDGWSGDAAGAFARAKATNEYVDQRRIAIPPPCGYVLSGPAEAFFAAAQATPPVAEALVEARLQSKRMDDWARRYPVGEATALLVDGELHALEGHGGRAIDRFEHALVAAKRLGLRFAQAQAELLLGRQRGADTVPGRGHLERARDLCRRCGARHHQREAERMLSNTDTAERSYADDGLADVLG